MSRSYAHRLMDSSEVAEMLPIGNKPASESHARELAPLKSDPTAMTAAMEAATEKAEAEQRKVTAKDVRESVRSISGAAEGEAAGENEPEQEEVKSMRRRGCCAWVASPNAAARLPRACPVKADPASGKAYWQSEVEGHLHFSDNW